MHKAFGSHQVLNGIDLAAHTGDVISIIGSSGSGKSTLLRCINLLETPDAGEVRVHGELIRMKTRRDGSREAADRKQLQRLRTRLSMVFQGFNLWPHLSVRDNIAIAVRKVQKSSAAEARDLAEAMLAKVHMAEKADVMPGQLSGGQQQRVALARSLATSPDLLLLDEPTNHLDAVAQDLLYDALSTFRGVGLLVSHDRKLLDGLCHQCLFVEPQGAILRPGNYSHGLQQAKKDETAAQKQRTRAKQDFMRLKREATRRRDSPGASISPGGSR